MAEQPTQTTAAEQTPAQPAQTPAAAASTAEQHVPYTRFQEVNQKYNDLKAQLAALNDEKQQQTTAAKSLEDRLAAIERERDESRAEALRVRVASKKQLPDDLADRLRGSTEEELLADAERLLAFVKPKSGPGVPPPGGGGQPSKFSFEGKSAEEIRKARREGKI